MRCTEFPRCSIALKLSLVTHSPFPQALQDLESLVDEHGEALAENPDLVEAQKLLQANPPPEN